ncbi:MFS transporter [Streptomyces sp. M2CJ-2]|uniref:MFS transporter n=1 Tax=Streptomyces sp. M2CJ-2 TaxID=2803948 RepID=UPI001926CFC4|nr:MFS transporter [Streptomyces sp. M2CJ-2]MBL3670998.1 MFS transporter [Streptomyces sp. M2CJ-2]
MTTVQENPDTRAGTALSAGARRWFGMLLVGFVALVLARAMSEGVYDLAFANLALDLSGLVTTIGLVYFAGYGVEVAASLLFAPLIDRGSPLRVLVIAYLVKTGLFGLIGLGSTFLSGRLWAIVVAAATVDMVHQVGEMALSVLLPRMLAPETLVRVQGVGATARSVGELLSPVLAGSVLALLPGARALMVAGVFQIVALLLLCVVLAAVRAHRRTVLPRGERSDDKDAAEPAGPVTRREVARTIVRSAAWRRYAVLDTLTTLALSSVVLSMLALLREQLGLSPARAATFMAFSTLGSIVGGLVVAKGGSAGLYRSMHWSPAVAGAGTLTMPLLGRNDVLLALCMILFGIGFTVYLRSAGLVLQLRAPLHLLGTWSGLLDAVGRVVCALGILLTGFALDMVGGTAVYAVFGVLLLVMGPCWGHFDRVHRDGLDATAHHPAREGAGRERE